MARKYKNIKDYVSKTEKIIGSNTVKAGLYLEGKIKGSFPPSGARGSVSGGGSSGNPSKPGGVPHVQSGTMKRSIKTGPLEKRRKELFVKVGSIIKPARGQNHSYPFMLEFGTSRMAKRPWARPAAKVNGKKTVRIITTGRI